MDFNENTIGCSPRVLQRLWQLDVEQLAKYPEREPVERIVADFLCVSPAELLLTNGVDEAIHLICQTYLEAGDEALIVVPTYSMYRIYAMAACARAVSVELGDDFQFDVERVIDRITPRTRLIAIANPNNPTGTVVPSEELLRIARAAPDAAVLIDEAYFEFYGKTIVGDREGYPNVFVARTFSKAYGLAGLRIGVLVGDVGQMQLVRHMASPYNVNAVALACLPEAIRDQRYVEQYVADVREARACLENALQNFRIKFWPSYGNFLLMRLGTATNAARFAQEMRRRGILVRDRSTDPGCEGCVRVTLGPKEHTERLLPALYETFEELGLAQGASRQ